MPITGELKSANATSSAQLVPTGNEVAVVLIHYRSTATGGTLRLLDGGSGGTEKMTVNTPAQKEGDGFPFPGGGLHFDDGVYAELTDVDGVTILYQFE